MEINLRPCRFCFHAAAVATVRLLALEKKNAKRKLNELAQEGSNWCKRVTERQRRVLTIQHLAQQEKKKENRMGGEDRGGEGEGGGGGGAYRTLPSPATRMFPALTSRWILRSEWR